MKKQIKVYSRTLTTEPQTKIIDVPAGFFDMSPKMQDDFLDSQISNWFHWESVIDWEKSETEHLRDFEKVLDSINP